MTSLACLAVTGAAAGKSIRVERYPGAGPIPVVLNGVLAAQDSPTVSTMMAELFGPLMQFPAGNGEPFDGASQFTSPDSDWLQQRKARIGAVALAGVISALVIQYRAKLNLREKVASLRQQENELAELAAEQQRLSNDVGRFESAPTVEPLQAPPELQTLRTEIERWREAGHGC